MTKQFILYRNTKDRTDFERESEVLDQMEADSESIDFEEFAESCEFSGVANQLGYDNDLPLEEDWHVTYSKSTFGGLPCYILGHSECDFIFLRQEDAKMLTEFHGQKSQGATLLEWIRRTGYGALGMDK